MTDTHQELKSSLMILMQDALESKKEFYQQDALERLREGFKLKVSLSAEIVQQLSSFATQGASAEVKRNALVTLTMPALWRLDDTTAPLVLTVLEGLAQNKDADKARAIDLMAQMILQFPDLATHELREKIKTMPESGETLNQAFATASLQKTNRLLSRLKKETNPSRSLLNRILRR